MNTNTPGGYRGTQGNIKDDASYFSLASSPARAKLNALVAHARLVSGNSKLSHREVLENLIDAAWHDLDADIEQAADDAACGETSAAR